MMSRELAFQLLESAVGAGEPAQDLASRLRAAGGLAPGPPTNAVVAFSSALANTLPKHWGVTRSVPDQLRQKQSRHNLLLQILCQAGILHDLSGVDLRTILENGEKIAAVTAVCKLEEALQLNKRVEDLQNIQHLVSLAGRAVESQTMVQNRETRELCYSKPTETVLKIFEAVCYILANEHPSLATTEVFSRALLGALSGASGQRSWQAQCFDVRREAASGQPGWTTSTPVRQALLGLVRHLVEALPTLQSDAPETLKDTCAILLELASPLLNAFAAEAAAKGTPASLDEYAVARQDALDPLLRCGIRWSEADDEDGEALLQSIETLAEVHRGYEQLFDVAAFRGDPSRLYEQMRASAVAAEGTPEFARNTLGAYLFSRLYADGRLGELLQLPDDFNAELYAWICDEGNAQQLLEVKWLHEIRIGECGAAAATLQDAAASRAAYGDARDRLTCLSRLAALAAESPGQALRTREGVC